MNYHNITKDDMLNGDGLRVVLWSAGCTHHCKGCQNPITWNPNDGVPFDENAKAEIFEQLSKDYISGITFSGGDPLYYPYQIYKLTEEIKRKYPNKSIWLYTGYTWEEILSSREKTKAILNIDVIVDGRFEEDKADVKYHWAGSTNQRVIDVQQSLKKGDIVLWNS